MLQEKEATLRRVKRELEALRLTAALLAEPTDKITLSAQAAQLAPPQRETPISMAPFAARETTSKRAWELSPMPMPLRPEAERQRIFPEPRDGVIVCDACGHRNPDYLVDCENCDIPIRLRN